jgi:hypothetical protein
LLNKKDLKSNLQSKETTVRNTPKYIPSTINTYYLQTSHYTQVHLHSLKIENLDAFLSLPNSLKTIEVLSSTIPTSNLSKSHRECLAYHIKDSLFLPVYIPNPSYTGCLLNYRKKQTWDLLIDEAVRLGAKVDGIEIEEVEIRRVDWREMERQGKYSKEEVMDGIVVREEVLKGRQGPMMVKLCRCLWSANPLFLLTSPTLTYPLFPLSVPTSIPSRTPLYIPLITYGEHSHAYLRMGYALDGVVAGKGVVWVRFDQVPKKGDVVRI